MCGFLHGLHSAHEAKDERGSPLGLVHRDVSPQNVLVGADGIPRVLDFGIAKAAGRVQVTRDGQIKGKLAYMPPEQLAGRELTRAVDIYASAVVMWETLTAERLFKGENEAETRSRILREPVPAPTAVNPALPPAFDGPLLRALSRDARKRHATAKELALEVEKCVGIASPTEVGEWVESLVGPIMSAREDVIQAIELNSAGMTVSQSIPPESSDSDMSVPHVAPRSRSAIRRRHAPHGSGHGQSGLSRASRTHSAVVGPPTPRASRRSGAPPPAPEALREDQTITQEQTGITGLITGTMTLPMSKKLPILASVGGVAVLLVVVGVVVAGKASGCDGEKPTTASMAAASSPPATTASTPTDRDIPEPAPLASAAPSASALAADDTPDSSNGRRQAEQRAPTRAPGPTHIALTGRTAARRQTTATTPRKWGCDPDYFDRPRDGPQEVQSRVHVAERI